MRDNFRVLEGYVDNDEIVHDVIINGKQFTRVPNLAKCKSCTVDSCKYYDECIRRNKGVVRFFDCRKNAFWVSWFWNFVTILLVLYFASTYYETRNLGFFKGTGAMLATTTVLDFLFTIIEELIEIMRNNYFSYKLQRKIVKEKAAEEEKRLAEEAKRMKEQAESDAKEPNRIKIREAEITLTQIATISEAINFGECDEKVEFCVTKCREIIDYLKQDSSGYIRVETLLQVYLPEFYKILVYYAEFEKAKVVEEAQNKKLNDTVNYFYDFLCKQKIEAIFDKEATEIKFNAAADTLRKEIERRGGKL